MLPKNLEVLKNEIENNVCSLCNKITPSCFMCLLCRRFAWANKCDLSINHTNGNLTEHAYSCNAGASILLSLKSNCLIYMFKWKCFERRLMLQKRKWRAI